MAKLKPYSNFVFVLGILLFLCGVTSSSDLLETKNGEVITPFLKLVANADGKSYFAEISPKRNWIEASAYCSSFSMKLAMITSASQWTALSYAFDSTTFVAGAYWTSGRDSQELKQFNWNDTDSGISGSYLPFQYYIPFPYQTCLAFYNRPNQLSFLYPRECSTPLGTLCET